MKTKLLSIAAAGLLIGSTALVQAQPREMNGRGASGASPGHEMQEHGTGNESGASGFAPGHDRDTTGAGDRDDRPTEFGGRDRDDRLRDDRDDRMMDSDPRGIDKDVDKE
jgi:hypothetical protein